MTCSVNLSTLVTIGHFVDVNKKFQAIALMRVFPKAILLTTKSHFHVKRTYASIRGLVVRTITSGKTRISAIFIEFLNVIDISFTF